MESLIWTYDYKPKSRVVESVLHVGKGESYENIDAYENNNRSSAYA